MDKYSPNIIQ